jgi:hypothetical protein
MFSPGGNGPFLQDERAIRDDQYKLVVDALCGGEQFFEYVAAPRTKAPTSWPQARSPKSSRPTWTTSAPRWTRWSPR